MKVENCKTKSVITTMLKASALSLLATATLLAGVSKAAAQGIELGEPEYRGTGCPLNSAGAVLSPDNTKLSVLFDQYVAEAGDSVGKDMDRKSCNLAIPVHVPHGYSVSVIKVDYRGFTSIPRGGTVRFNVSYFFAGSEGPRISEVMRGPREEDFLLTDRLIATADVWSPCGVDTNIRINTSLVARSNSYGDDIMATLDSTDVDTKLVYHLQWRRCR